MMNADPPRIKDSAYVLNNIGAVLKSEGKYGEALDFYQRALIIREKYYPTGHLDTSASINNIGRVFEAQGKYDEALDFYQRALIIQEKYYPNGHPDIAYSLNNIGNVLSNQGKYKEALDFHRRAQVIQEKYFPPDHSHIATSLYNIGGVLHRQAKYAEALDFYRRALVIREKHYPAGHPDTASCLNNIGRLFSDQGKYDDAIDIYHKALTILQKLNRISDHSMAILSKYKLDKYQFGTDVRKGQQLYGLSGKIIYEGKWISRRNDSIIIVEMNEAIAEREASFYLEVNDHHNIIHTFGCVENSLNLTIFVQEFAELADLAGVLMDNQFNISQTILVEMFLQISDAMSFIARKKIVHCDLGCRNVLVFNVDPTEAKNNLVKITDFGLARWIDEPPSNENKSVIPVRFCAPEILRNKRHSDYSEKSDVYSMGVLMWEALSNSEIPYSSIAEDDDVIRIKLNNEKLKKPRDCDHQLWVLMTKCWHEDPEQRLTFEDINNKLSNIKISEVAHHQTSGSSNKTRIHYDYKLGDHVKINGSLNRPLPAIHQAEWLTEETSSIVLIERKEELSESEKLLYTTYKKHDHLVYTYGFVENNRGSIMILQEKAPHGNLRALLESGQFNPSAKVLIEIFFQILDAMIHIVDHGLVHGDLRCENVLVFEMDPSNPKRNRVKLGNFALAHENDPSLVDDRRLVIPVRYCAPEILRSAGRSNYSELSDVYSMGVLMWQAWSNGKLPYESSTHNSEIRQRKLNGEILSKPFMCDPQIWAIMRDCWNKELICRFDFSGIKTRLSQVNIASIETYKHELNVDVKQLRPLNGKFYEAEWIPKKDQQPIVLMIMDEETAEQEALFYTKFEREPHIVDTFGFVKNDRKLIMLLLERASHGDLQTLLENGEFQPSEKVLVAIFLQIIEAMIYIISHKIVHGDLRCANVLVFQMDAFDSKRNSVKLTNFTMACPIDHPVSKKRVREDLMKYYAPEICQFNDRSIYTELSDVYSMGVLMWQARSKGAIPFSHRTSDGNIQEQKSSYKALPKPKHCNSELWSVIETCCCNEPSIRDNFEKVKTQLLIINFE
ncbi:unnamed protein product [Rotaria sp. Silwood1]|nr:unnamed protein product [Rotaria sp. Silwood1]CAF3673295.1 unnamed protein product [Rotaria sp. Silwood1]